MPELLPHQRVRRDDQAAALSDDEDGDEGSEPYDQLLRSLESFCV